MTQCGASKLRLSIVVVVYNMEREARRTLHSLSASYQHGVCADDYEVIVMDNGSPRPFNNGSVAQFGRMFSYHSVTDANQSPAQAINLGVQLARSDFVGVMIDGARILSPGVIRYALALSSMFHNPYGVIHSWHIGPAVQWESIEQGYDQREEDRLLEQIGWPRDGYRLFEISALDPPREEGWFRPIWESNCSFMRKQTFEEVGGYDERFTLPGGGLVNPDIHARLCELPTIELVTILGEGTFHQLHGGATSGVPAARIQSVMEAFGREYRRIRGREWRSKAPSLRSEYVGHIPAQALRWLQDSAVEAQPNFVKRGETIVWLHGEVAQRDNTIGWLHDEVAKRDKMIQWLHDEVAMRDEAVAWLHREVAKRDGLLERLNSVNGRDTPSIRPLTDADDHWRGVERSPGREDV